jgi:exportin-7
MGKVGPNLAPHLINNVFLLLSRITKLGWLEEQSNRDLCEKIKKYFTNSSNPKICIIGLKFFNQLVNEMNTITVVKSINIQRKVGISFRDVALRGIFESSLFILREMEQDSSIRNESVINNVLELFLSILKFDFVGVFPDDTTEEITNVQVPSSWRPLFEESDTLPLMWKIYENLKMNDAKSKIIEVIVLLASVRRSLFTGDEDRQSYLKNLISGTVNLLKNRESISDEETLHQISRLLSRIKSNFQLKELIDCGDEVYENYLDLCAKFTIESYHNTQFSQYSSYYLLNLWSRLVSSQPYLHNDKDSKLKKYIPDIFKEYVKSRLILSQHCTENGLDSKYFY